MTKGVGVLVAVAFALTAIPSAHAHGAAEGREIDLRLLSDDEGVLAFGGCFDAEATAQCVPGLESEGLDLLVLEVREAFLQAQPALVFRIVYQTDDAHEGRALDLTFQAAGKEHAFSFSTDGTSPPTGNFDALAGPFDVFDGYPKAIDGYLKYSTLGVKTGDELTEIQVMSTFDGEASDAMPGTWYASGEAMPYIPNAAEEGEAEQPPPARYTLKGPAKLLEITMDGEPGMREVNVTVKNPLATLPQFVTFASQPGISFDSQNLNLEAGATRQVKLTISSVGVAQVNVTSDLDYFEILKLGEGSTTPPTTSPPPSTLGNATSSLPMTSDAKGSPAIPIPAAILAVLIITLVRRRL